MTKPQTEQTVGMDEIDEIIHVLQTKITHADQSMFTDVQINEGVKAMAEAKVKLKALLTASNRASRIDELERMDTKQPDEPTPQPTNVPFAKIKNNVGKAGGSGIQQPDGLDSLQEAVQIILETHFDDYKYPGPKGGAMASELVAAEIAEEAKSQLLNLVREARIEELKQVEVANKQGFYNIINRADPDNSMITLNPPEYVKDRLATLRKEQS